MSLSIVVNGGGTFSASMEEGPVSFTASLGAVPGPKGDTGATGAAGTNGVGVPVGGTTGQVLGKASATNYDTAWISNNPFNQTLNTTSSATFGELTVTDGSQSAFILPNSFLIDGTIEGLNITGSGFFVLGSDVSMTSGGFYFPNNTSQSTALPNGTADGNIVEWDADTSTYISVPNDARTLFLNGTNKTGTTIAKGKAVYISGATGNHPEITLAQANSELSSARTIGITSEAIANNATGRVIVAGLLENVNTSAFTAGDTLYLSSSTAGGFQTTLPTQPNHGVLMGYVLRSNANNGVIEVRVDDYQELGEQSDVLLTSKTNLDLLSYETSSGLWKNKSFSTLGLLTSSAAASTYAPLASPTFTGTVTIPAGASISGFLTSSTAASTYAPLASPALTGNPTAPTPDTSDNDTSIATTAFVNAFVPAASTTVAGKVELATEAEAVAGTSATLAVTPFGLSMARLNPSFFSYTSTDAASLTSGGSAFVSAYAIRTLSGTANASYGGRVFEASVTTGSFSNRTNNSVAFSKPIWLSAKCSVATSSETSAYQQRFLFGKRGTGPSGTDIGDLAVAGFGIRCNGGGNAIVLQVHNGTTLTNVTSSFSPTAGSFFDVEIYSDGAGNVTLYVNGSSVATSANGPTVNSTTIFPTVYVETVATAAVTTASNTAFVVSAIKLDLNSNV